ncbi:MAG: ABC transporter ATP-binding protein [Curvibacter sp.]|nr:MAG: ABC transporter ATP-binding protein [Curvibacter sp.]
MFLDVHDLEIRYSGRDHLAVDRASLGLKAGEIGVLLGPSGCGKTTLLRAVAGLEPVSAGSIRLAGEWVSGQGAHVPPEGRRIGMVFQDYALFPHLSVADNIRFGLHRQARDQQSRRVDEVLALVGLSASARRYPHELSGGQQQRVALARALAPRPHLMLLDEPFSNLDVELRERLAQEVRSILKEAQTTALFVTHDQMEAFALGDLIGVMSQGRMHQWADAATVYREPATRFVADFIGHGVFLSGHVSQEAGQSRIETPLGALPAPVQRASGPCDVLLRASDVSCDPAPDAPQAQIVRKLFRGADSLYELRLDDGQRLLAQLPSHLPHPVGSRIGVRARPEHTVVFDRVAPGA